MSLRVWLPLNGNLNNQGIGSEIISNNGATVNYSGKIGSCYSFNGSSNNIKISNMTKPENISVSMWFKRNANTGTRQFLFTAWNGITLELDTSGNITCSVASNNSQIGFCNGPTITTSSGWTHICFIFENGVGTKLYINGNLYSYNNFTTSIQWNTTEGYIGYYNTYFNGCVNDFRIYDHALSSKEVKEISKGLLVHYKLDNGGFGNPNLFLNTHFDSLFNVSAWNTTKNGTLCANYWGGYNAGVNNPSSVYHAHIELRENEYVYNYHKTSDEGWLGIACTVTNVLTAGKTYTFSCELKRISGTNRATGGLYTYASTSATGNTFINYFDFSEFSSVTDNKWHKYSYTFTISNSAYISHGAQWYIYGSDGSNNGEFLLRRLKLEEGSICTQWIPNTNDTIYSSLGLNKTTEYDCSGFNRFGIKSGSFILDSNSPKYESCTKFGSTSTKIRLPAFNMSGFANTYTFTWWEYISNGEDIMPWGFSDGNRLNVYHSTNLYWNTGDGSSNPFTPTITTSSLKNAWHHIAVTGNGSETKIYIDGVYRAKATSYKSLTGTQIYISGWDSGTSYAFNGCSISDFRMYATVLSDNDIKELYRTSASVDKSGNIYALEFKEE